MKSTIIKSVLCIAMLVLDLSDAWSQISEGGIPPSFQYAKMLRSSVAQTKVPINFYAGDLLEMDDWQARSGAPKPVAKLVTVDYTMENSGAWTTLPGGERVWQLTLKAADAVALMLYYKDFYIPEGGKLFIYSADKEQILGAYTNRTNRTGGLFATEFVGGDELTLEYVASSTNDEKPRIEIKEIGYGYNGAALREFCSIKLRRQAAECMVNVNCEEGEAWQNEKKGVMYTVMPIRGVSYICSAVLLNNTAEDYKPLVLTARHCAIDNRKRVATSDEMLQWTFYFHREREGCTNSSNTKEQKTMVGCYLAAKSETNTQADGMLLLLKDRIPEDYDVYYNGWDRRDEVPTSGVCLHHPDGDFMKISTFNSPAATITFVSSSEDYYGDTNAHLNVTFSKTPNGHGVTADGSSGSPLFNQNKLVVGTLTGGNSECDKPGGLNLYGKLAYNWDKYKTKNDSLSSMDVWLDPIGSGVNTLAGRYQGTNFPSPKNLKVSTLAQTVHLQWERPGNAFPIKYYIYRNNERIGETAALSFEDENPIVGSVIYSVSAVYDDWESSFASQTLLFVESKAPTDFQGKLISSNRIKLTWKAPEYEQTIYWGDISINNGVGFAHGKPFYFGQRWLPDEIKPLHKKTVTAVQFVPKDGFTYEVYVSQGDRTYSQKIGQLGFDTLNTVKLDKPFVINADTSLIVSVYVSESYKGYPAVCDAGPVFDGKGNIYSNDGKEWKNLYDSQNKPDQFNYNFVVTAIVSSIEGDLTKTRHAVVASNPMADLGEARSAMLSEPSSGADMSLRSTMPSSFPEVLKYNLYRDNALYRQIQAPTTEFTDNVSGEHTYDISALYDGNRESAKVRLSGIVASEFVENDYQLLPTMFANNLTLTGFDSVVSVEAVSMDGKICMRVEHPGNTIDASSLSQGIYIFRIYGEKNKLLKVVRCLKTE